MAERAYNLSRINVHNLKYMDIISTDVVSDIILTYDSPQLQFLNPNDLHININLISAMENPGGYFIIENTSMVTGTLRLWDESGSNLIGIIHAGYRGFIISNGAHWRMTSEPTMFAHQVVTSDGLILASDWALDNSGRPAGSDWYYINVNHGLASQYVQVQAYDNINKTLIYLAEVDYIDSYNVKLWINSPIDIHIIIKSVPDINNEIIQTTDWILDNTGKPAGTNWYYKDVINNLATQYMNVQCVDLNNNQLYLPAEIEFLSNTLIRIWSNEQSHTIVLVGEDPLTIASIGSVPLINAADWTLDNTGRPAGSDWYYKDVNHLIGKQYNMTQFVDNDNKQMIIPAEVYYTDDDNLRVWVNDNSLNLRVII